jgi:hypothetical protein
VLLKAGLQPVYGKRHRGIELVDARSQVLVGSAEEAKAVAHDDSSLIPCFRRSTLEYSEI